MKSFKNLIILKMLFCVLVPNIVNAGILWEKELVLDANTNSSPFASCLNKDGNGIIVMTVESPKGSFPIKGDNILWEIGADGNAIRILPKNAMPAGVGPGCAIASDSLGNFLTVGILSKQKDEKGQKVATISKANKTERTMLLRNNIESHSAKKLVSLQDNTFILVGDKEGNGLCLRIDNQGKIMQEKLFDTGQTDMFSGVDRIKPDSSNLVVVGLSANLSMKDYHENSAESFILIYDPNLNLVHEDHFANENSVSMFSLLLPKVCCLDNGNIAVLYKKENADPNKTLLWTRCYTKELKLLWDKEVFVADKQPSAMDITSRDSSGFTIGIVPQTDNLEFYYFNESGMQTGHTQYKGIVGIAGFNLMRVGSRTIAVFEEGTAGNIKECTIRAKVIALD